MEAKCSGRSCSDSETLERNGAVMNEPTASTLAIKQTYALLIPCTAERVVGNCGLRAVKQGCRLALCGYLT